MTKTYTNQNCVQFVNDMQSAGLKINHYNGRFWYQGPSVTVDNLQDALRLTEVKVKWDSMGKGFVVHPVQSDAGQ